MLDGNHLDVSVFTASAATAPPLPRVSTASAANNFDSFSRPTGHVFQRRRDELRDIGLLEREAVNHPPPPSCASGIGISWGVGIPIAGSSHSFASMTSSQHSILEWISNSARREVCALPARRRADFSGCTAATKQQHIDWHACST